MSRILLVVLLALLPSCGGKQDSTKTKAPTDLDDLAGELDTSSEVESHPQLASSGPRYSPLVWTVKNKSGKTNYLFAAHSFVTASELPAEVWELVGEATMIAEPFDVELFKPAFDQLPNRLRTQLSPRDLTRVLIQLPATRRRYLTKFSPEMLAYFLHRPARPPGPGIGHWVRKIAETKKLPLRYYGGDFMPFVESFLALGDRPSLLLTALDDPRPGKRLAEEARDAYLRGDPSGVNAHEIQDPSFRGGYQALIQPWLPRIIRILEDSDQALIMVSSEDFFIDGGVMKGLEEAGYQLERALPDSPPSISQWVPNYVPLDKCHDLLLHFVAIVDPEASLVLHNASDQDEVFSSEEVRPIMGGCLRRAIGYYKCGLAAQDRQEFQDCENRFPMHTEDLYEE